MEETPLAGSAQAVRVRATIPDDAARLSLLGRATFLESYALWLTDPACHGWLAETPGGAPVGYLIAMPPDLPLPGLGPQDLEIRRIYVLHRYQGLGLGRWLMEEALTRARSSGCLRVLLGVYSLI